MTEKVAPAVAAALEALRRAGSDWLAPGKETVVAAAPGRLDVMGGIADYSGATVLEATIGDLAVVALQRRDDSTLRVATTGPETGRLQRHDFQLSLDDFYADPARTRAALKSYEAVRALFPPEARWAAYVLGVFYVLLAEGEVDSFPGGADLLVRSTVPLGAGVASSAALEVAAMCAVAAAYGARTAGLRLAALCQVVENRVVGAPCGIMDQVTCALGQAGALLALRCRPHDILGWHEPPPGFTFLGLDSGVKHAVGGVRYPLVRTAAFMGRRIVQESLRQAGEDPAQAAYLCNLTPALLRARFRDVLPARIAGREFLERWGDHGDPATSIDPVASYPVRGATEHPVYEHHRVQRFISLLDRAGAAATEDEGRRTEDAGRRTEDERRNTASAAHLGPPSSASALMRAAGRLMYGSHRSYSRNCGLGSRETDLLVQLVRTEGPEHGLYGAKITGGGSGGTVAVLAAAGGASAAVSPEAATALERVQTAYAAAIGRPPRVIAGSAPGAAHLPPARLAW